jgi:hypothetical protein
MQYRKDKKGNDLSILGYGCMRFTKKGLGIDLEKAQKEIQAAIRGGVNYFDTAYIYTGSEAALGQIFANLACRDNIMIATKLPHYLIKSREGADRLFAEQLKRLKTDHVDYYLMHMLTDIETWNRLCLLGIREWIEEKLASGQIRNIGFSYHGNSDMFLKLVDAYPWDFCQIQYNYMDENSQAGRRGLLYAHEKGLPVIIMEPLRGGRLAGLLPKSAKDILRKSGGAYTPAELALRWLWDQKEVTCVLSGMNSLEMVEENMGIAAKAYAGMMTPEDFDLVDQVRREINLKSKVGCTGCGYCMPCPQGVDIPGTFRAYNLLYTEGAKVARKEYMMCTALRRKQASASQCIQCGICEPHCPQHIPIRLELKNAAKELETPVYKIVKKIVSMFRIY